jgi:hypothetical protein
MYLVSAVGLQAVTWAVIALLRNLLIGGIDPPTSALAFQMAVVLIGLPIFLGHWLWAQRLAGGSVEERGATLRRLYLYGMMAAFLGPFVANTFDLIGTLLRAQSTLDRHPFGLSGVEGVVYHLLALIVLAVLWVYHDRINRSDARAVPIAGHSATVRRLYVMGFSAAGLAMTSIAIVNLVEWLLLQIGQSSLIATGREFGPASEAARLLVGTPLWLIFWYQAQQLFEGPARAERESVLRKLYLYGAVFAGALTAVVSMTGILAGLFRSLLALPPQGDIRQPLAVIVGMGLLWGLHAYFLRSDSKMADDAPRQRGVRRLYLYLVAAIGLAALLVGLSGDISVLLRSLDGGFGDQLREELAWFTAAIIAGLPVWLIPWRWMQNEALEPGRVGSEARQSIVRKIYLYFYLFVAAMTVLSAVIFIVAQLLTWVLGSDAPTLAELGQAIAFSLIAVAVWLYHGALLRTDGRLAGQTRAQSLADLRLVILDVAEGQFGQAVVAALKQITPDLVLEPVVLKPQTGEVSAEEQQRCEQELVGQLAQAQVIAGPWEMAMPGGAVTPAVAQAVRSSPAQKLLAPLQTAGWHWVGVEAEDHEAMVEQTVQAIKQIAAGEPVSLSRPLSLGAIAGIVVAVLLGLILLGIPLLVFFASRM